jgi:hypothetical protein
MTFKEAAASVLAERSRGYFLTTLSTVLGTWLMTSTTNVRSIKTEIQGWPTGHSVTTFINDDAKYALLAAACPIDDNGSLLFGVMTQSHRRGPVRDFLASKVSAAQFGQHVAADLQVMESMDFSARGVHVREDRSTLEYLKLYDRYVARVEPTWLAGRTALSRRAGGEGRPTPIGRGPRAAERVSEGG